MSESKTAKKRVATPKMDDITFICKFCGETKPLIDMVLMREYFPPLPACRECAVKNKTENDEVEEEKNTD